MPKLRVLVVEDNPSFAIELEMLLAKDYELVGIYDTAKEVLEVLENIDVDLILSDIFLKGPMNGIELAEQIKDKHIPVIFMTFSKDEDLYLQSKSENTIAYLVKPFDLITLRSIIEVAFVKMGLIPKSIDSNSSTNEEEIIKRKCFYIRTNKELVKVNVADIKWIQSDGNYCLIVTKSRKYAIKLSLVKIFRNLSKEDFIQIHKSYLVQLSYITQIDTSSNQLFIADDPIPIGRKYKPALMSRLDWLL